MASVIRSGLGESGARSGELGTGCVREQDSRRRPKIPGRRVVTLVGRQGAGREEVQNQRDVCSELAGKAQTGTMPRTQWGTVVTVEQEVRRGSRVSCA